MTDGQLKKRARPRGAAEQDPRHSQGLGQAPGHHTGQKDDGDNGKGDGQPPQQVQKDLPHREDEEILPRPFCSQAEPPCQKDHQVICQKGQGDGEPGSCSLAQEKDLPPHRQAVPELRLPFGPQPAGLDQGQEDGCPGDQDEKFLHGKLGKDPGGGGVGGSKGDWGIVAGKEKDAAPAHKDLQDIMDRKHPEGEGEKGPHPGKIFPQQVAEKGDSLPELVSVTGKAGCHCHSQAPPFR